MKNTASTYDLGLCTMIARDNELYALVNMYQTLAFHKSVRLDSFEYRRQKDIYGKILKKFGCDPPTNENKECSACVRRGKPSCLREQFDRHIGLVVPTDARWERYPIV